MNHRVELVRDLKSFTTHRTIIYNWLPALREFRLRLVKKKKKSTNQNKNKKNEVKSRIITFLAEEQEAQLIRQ